MGNLALNKTATASSFVAPFAPGRAVDGSLDPKQRWVCSAPQKWMTVDLGPTDGQKWINRWVVKQMSVVGGNYWGNQGYAMSDYKLQISSDNVNFTDIDSVVNNTANTTDRTIPMPFSARYVRVSVSKGLNTNNQVAAIMELELYEAAQVSLLSNLVVNPGTLNPAFNSRTLSYSVNVAYDISSIALTPTPVQSGAQIQIKKNGTIVPSDQWQSISLPTPGSYNITVEVTSGTTTIYTLNVTRASNASYLSSMILKNDRNNEVPLTPPFTRATLTYSASVGSGIASVSVTPTAEDPGATIKVNGVTVISGQESDQISLNPGPNTITVQVSAPGGGQSNYTITVTKG